MLHKSFVIVHCLRWTLLLYCRIRIVHNIQAEAEDIHRGGGGRVLGFPTRRRCVNVRTRCVRKKRFTKACTHVLYYAYAQCKKSYSYYLRVFWRIPVRNNSLVFVLIRVCVYQYDNIAHNNLQFSNLNLLLLALSPKRCRIFITSLYARLTGVNSPRAGWYCQRIV